MPSSILDRVGGYQIVSLLGEGGMAQVYLALLHGPADFKKLGVIKRIRPELAWDGEFIAMFLNEARLAARLNHPNVVQTYQVLKEAGTYHLAMEFLDGQPLSAIFERLGRRSFSLEEHLWILSQVLSGLDYAHSLTDFDGKPLYIVHRDVCPANVFLTYDGNVKLLDFGIAKVAGVVGATRPGTMKGRLGYCAPEQIEGGPVDARADVFAVGVMLWEALAGRRMVRGASPEKVIEARLSGHGVKVAELCPDLPGALAEICERAMALAPDRRYANARELLRDIQTYLDTMPRRVGQAHLAARLHAPFAEDRRVLRQQVETQLSMPFETATGTADPRSEVTTVVQPSPMPPAAKRPTHGQRWMPGWLGLGAAAVLTAVALWPTVRAGKHRAQSTIVARSGGDGLLGLGLDPTGARAASSPAEGRMLDAGPLVSSLRGWWRGSYAQALVVTQVQPVSGAARGKHDGARAGRRQVGPGPVRGHARGLARADTKVNRRATRDNRGPVPPVVEPGALLTRPVAKRPLVTIDEEDPYRP